MSETRPKRTRAVSSYHIEDDDEPMPDDPTDGAFLDAKESRIAERNQQRSARWRDHMRRYNEGRNTVLLTLSRHHHIQSAYLQMQMQPDFRVPSQFTIEGRCLDDVGDLGFFSFAFCVHDPPRAQNTQLSRPMRDHAADMLANQEIIMGHFNEGFTPAFIAFLIDSHRTKQALVQQYNTFSDGLYPAIRMERHNGLAYRLQQLVACFLSQLPKTHDEFLSFRFTNQHLRMLRSSVDRPQAAWTFDNHLHHSSQRFVDIVSTFVVCVTVAFPDMHGDLLRSVIARCAANRI